MTCSPPASEYASILSENRYEPSPAFPSTVPLPLPPFEPFPPHLRAGSLKPATPMLEPRSGHTATLLRMARFSSPAECDANQDFYKSAELYDPATGKFQPTGEMHQRRVGQVAVLLSSGKVLSCRRMDWQRGNRLGGTV